MAMIICCGASVVGKNIGSLDQVVRIVLSFVIFGLFFVLEGNLRWLAVVGFVPFVTGLLRFCPVYRILGLNTAERE